MKVLQRVTNEKTSDLDVGRRPELKSEVFSFVTLYNTLIHTKRAPETGHPGTLLAPYGSRTQP